MRLHITLSNQIYEADVVPRSFLFPQLKRKTFESAEGEEESRIDPSQGRIRVTKLLMRCSKFNHNKTCIKCIFVFSIISKLLHIYIYELYIKVPQNVFVFVFVTGRKLKFQLQQYSNILYLCHFKILIYMSLMNSI